MFTLVRLAFKHTAYTSLDVFFFNDTATTEIYTLSLHDALPISVLPDVLELRHGLVDRGQVAGWHPPQHEVRLGHALEDRKSTRLNSSHVEISYAVFCLKKKKKKENYKNHGRTDTYIPGAE